MCYVIVTGRSLLWTLLSLAALMAVLSGLITPRWLVGPLTIKDTSKYCVGSFSTRTRYIGGIPVCVFT